MTVKDFAKAHTKGHETQRECRNSAPKCLKTAEGKAALENAYVKENSIPVPKRVLFSRKRLQIGWKSTDRKWQVGVGMKNVGNTCYLNSTLQALFHIPAMANWLMSDTAHIKTCNSSCITCAMAKTLIESQSSFHAIQPYQVYTKLKSISNTLVAGRQEDAHEFLGFLIEAMKKSFRERFNFKIDLDEQSKETTPLNQIFGGYLKSSIQCSLCNHVSITKQYFQDLALDINKSDTVEEAIENYFSPECVEGMEYKCEACRQNVAITKQLFLERSPIVFCLQLKRFTFSGSKLNKDIRINTRLDVKKFTSDGTQELTYRLVSMITHLGKTQYSGHYTAIGLTQSDKYYQYDDMRVQSISVDKVCNTQGYILFYEIDAQPPQKHVQ